MSLNLIFTNDVAQEIDNYVANLKPSGVFVHVDVNTAKFVMPILESQCEAVKNAKIIVSLSGDANKNIESLTKVWKSLSDAGATRSSLLINVGGGVVTDLGGFAAATFKRGMTVLNVPTTLLGAVDASVGGKTGINFNGYKNQVGAFYSPDATIISTTFFQTLPEHEMLAGYAEMIKHALLKGRQAFRDVMAYNVTLPPVNPDALINLLRENVLVKKEYVEQDPTETGLRKALNLGHTVAHALESFALNDRKNSISHGFAVAQGLVVEAILSGMSEGFPGDDIHTLAKYVKDNYGPYYITCDDYPRLISYMYQDKKNFSNKEIVFTLLREPGKPVINIPVPEENIKAALDIYRDLMGI